MTSAEPARRPRPADDDELPELPAIDGDDETNAEATLAFDDEDDEPTDDDETVGLDASTGVEEDEDFLDAFEDEPVSEGWEASDDSAFADSDLDGDDEEGGWTEGSEASGSDGWEDADLDDVEEPAAAPIRDAGEEGVEERYDGEGEDDLPFGAAILADAGEDELADDLELEGEGEIDAMPGGDERLEHPALALPRALAEARWIGPEDDTIVAIGGGLAGGRTLYRIEEDRAEPIELDVLDGDEPTSIAQAASGALIVGLQLGGAKRSTDGHTFTRIESLRRGESASSTGAFHVLAEPHEGGVRLWGRTRGGALVRSEDEGASWSGPLIPNAVIALALAADGGVVGVLGARSGAPRLVRTADGGRSWRNLAGPPLDCSIRTSVSDEHEVFVAAMGAHLVIAVDGPGLAPFASSDDGQSWRRLDALRDAGAVVIVDEGEGPVLYAALLAEGRDRGLVARMPLADGAAPRIVVDLEEVRARHHVMGAGDPSGDQRIHALVVERSEGATTLLIASGIGVVRAQV